MEELISTDGNEKRNSDVKRERGVASFKCSLSKVMSSLEDDAWPLNRTV